MVLNFILQVSIHKLFLVANSINSSYVESQIMEGVCVSMRGHNCVASKITVTTRHQAMVVIPPPVTPRILLSQEQAWETIVLKDTHKTRSGHQ